MCITWLTKKEGFTQLAYLKPCIDSPLIQTNNINSQRTNLAMLSIFNWFSYLPAKVEFPLNLANPNDSDLVNDGIVGDDFELI